VSAAAEPPRAGTHGPGRTVAGAVTFWRRSIQARVVASTVLLTTLVVGVVGWFLLQQTRDGLLDNRIDVVMSEVSAETAAARARMDAVPYLETNEFTQRQDLIEPIKERGNARGFSVALAGPVEPGGDGGFSSGGAFYTPGLDLASIPDELRERFSGVADPAWTYTRIRTDGAPSTTVVAGPGIVVGSQIRLPADGRTYTLYYLFPLDEEEETLSLVTRALLTAMVLLLVMVAGVAWLVTRQVVTPVRLARRVAERLTAGELEERMRVRGEDDLARLAASFNQMATSLQRQIRQLEELSRVQRRFVSDVSHELRTPLATVRMAGDLIHDARGDFDPAAARAAELLQTELDRFETLLSDLLEISRFDAGAAALEVDDVDLADVVRRVAESTEPLARQRDTQVVLRAPDEPVLAQADVRRVERIVRNLVTNAIDHAESREIEVTVAGDEEAAAVAVRDHGVGLAPGEAAMVFNRFWRADPARARSSGGTGLGLSISLEDTHLHGGWLQAWGQPGEGSQFRLTLPRHQGEPLRHSPLPLVPLDARETV
jgi:two-component system sensor histidine kinase MtrB